MTNLLGPPRRFILLALALTWIISCGSSPPTDEPIVLPSAHTIYLEIRGLLTGSEAQSWWEDLRGDRSPSMILWVVDADLDGSPPVLRLALEPDGPAEVTLRIDYLCEGEIKEGQPVIFSGVPTSLRLNPFHLTLTEGQAWPLSGDRAQSARPSVSLTIEPAHIEPGETTTLHWESQNGCAAKLNQGIGRVELTGRREVTPNATTTYTFSIRGPGGEASVSATVTVQPRSAQ